MVRAALTLAFCLAAAPAVAGCRLALLLALDVSASVDRDEDLLQRQGLARALLAPAVEEAFLAFGDDHVALAVYEWSGRHQQDLLLDWTVITGAEDLAVAAATVATSERGHDDMPTALGYALGHAASLFERAPDCTARKLDVSGDGRNNEGFGPDLAYREFPLDGVTINGLAISESDREIADYYRRKLIRGPGAFVIEVTRFEDYEAAMEEKLLRELEGPVVSMLAPRSPG
ncbi:DUF1194 domain-containing protein [Defluviimonas sp. WL0050]|uniref:DUF1194 domain-containing protein n=1 Tax=Albidovulum litorale TaxID=2984134 RepID=A0ABT2ZQX1_9RHOB|nr:DUF1194 domain-containing protein [Defluviimonas sp. WL0050]MCV2873442.1 DUF1194 domain-containing protein [Defluviimonas sp. WL0050]